MNASERDVYRRLIRDAVKLLRASRRALGVCISCGKHPPGCGPNGRKFSQCEYCRKRANHARKLREIA